MSRKIGPSEKFTQQIELKPRRIVAQELEQHVSIAKVR